MKYRPDIDGLRAVAVLSVLFFHAGASVFSGGYVGVDVFFVISGYVIAQTLNEDFKGGTYSIWRFYAKRIRRIFPALFTTIAATLVVGYFVLLPSFYRSTFASVIATSTFLSNIYFWKDSGYFAADALSRPLLHTWSLAVEEQYYLIAPLVMYGVFRTSQKWRVIFIPVILLSLALSIYATTTAPTANFFLLPTRAWELLIGALLALSPPRQFSQKNIHEVVAAVGLAFIGYAVFFFTKATAFPGLHALYPCLGAALIIYSGQNNLSFVGKILSTSPMVTMGRLSYSLYLIHWPVIVFFYFHTLSPPTLLQLPVIVTLCLALAYLSWRFVEQPFRHLDGKIMQHRLLIGGTVMIVLFVAVGLVGMKADGFPARFPNYAEEKIIGKVAWNSGACFLEGDPDPKPWSYDKCLITHNHPETALLWGDSFAAQYVPGIKANETNIPYNIAQYTAAGCPPVLSYQSYARLHCTDFNAHALDIIREHNIKTVVLSARWTDMESRGLDQIQSTLTALDALGVKTYVIGQSPEFSIDTQILAFSKGDPTKNSIDRWDVFFDPTMNQTLAKLVGDHSFINPMTTLCDGASCPYRDNGEFLFSDYGHFSVEGSTRAVRAYFPLYQK